MAAQGSTGPKKRRRIPIEHYDRVSTMLVSMVPYSMIVKQLSAEWKKPKKYIMEVVTAVHEDWANQAAVTQHTRRHQIRQAFEFLYMKATAAKDITNAARIMRELGLLDGSYAKTEVAVSHSGGVGVGISLGALGFKTPDEVQARIEELRARLALEGPKVLQSLTPNASALLPEAQSANVTTTNGVDHEHDVAPTIIDVPPGDEEGTS
jgi:hypothetical protein